MIHTTINCNMDVLQLLEAAAALSGRTRSGVISLLLRRVMREFRTLTRDNRSVKYQERNPITTRKKVHIAVPIRDYEFFIDMRKLFKWSVSALVAYGVQKHLAELLEKISGESYDEYADNYPFNCYFLVNDILDGAVGWRIYWGKPGKTKLLLPQMRD